MYNEVNQLVRREKGSEIQGYLYDANGNLLQTVQNGGVIARYRYDSADNMVFAETKQGREEYQYNGFGKKTGMKVEMAGYEGDGTQEERATFWITQKTIITCYREIQGEGQKRISGITACCQPAMRKRMIYYTKKHQPQT